MTISATTGRPIWKGKRPRNEYAIHKRPVWRGGALCNTPAPTDRGNLTPMNSLVTCRICLWKLRK